MKKEENGVLQQKLIKISKDSKFKRIGKSSFGVENTDIVLSTLCDVSNGMTINMARQILF